MIANACAVADCGELDDDEVLIEADLDGYDATPKWVYSGFIAQADAVLAALADAGFSIVPAARIEQLEAEVLTDGFVRIGGQVMRVVSSHAPRTVHIGHRCDRYEITYDANTGPRMVVTVVPVEVPNELG